mgnify:CR=1 FL=1
MAKRKDEYDYDFEFASFEDITAKAGDIPRLLFFRGCVFMEK